MPGDSSVPPDDPDVPPDQGVPAVPPLGEYIADIEGCVDELARRLEMKPGRINIKVLAKMFRDTVVQYDILHQGRPAMFSDLLDVFGPDQSMWARFASKNSPVGYLIEEFMRKQAEYQDDDQDDQDDDQDDNRAEVEEAKARIMEVLPGMRSIGGGAFVKAFEISLRLAQHRPDDDVLRAALDGLVDDGRVTRAPHDYRRYKAADKVAA